MAKFTEEEQTLRGIERRFNKGVVQYGLIEESDKILIGLSGGKDSLALVELLGKRAKIFKPRFSVVAVHVVMKNIPYQSDLEFLTNIGLARRQDLDNAIAQSEIQKSFYSYTITIDLDRIGVDGDLEISAEEKADRVKKFLDTIQYLYRDIKGRRENLSPVFAIGGRYIRKNPFFENRVSLENGAINTKMLGEIIESDEDIKNNTSVGVVTGIFQNDAELKDTLNTKTVADVFKQLKKEVDEYYGASN